MALAVLCHSPAAVGSKALSITERWHKWLAEYPRRQAIDNRPSRFTSSLVAGGAFVGRWFAGASGIGAALAVSAMFSSYTSLTSVDADHICIASQFVSRTMREGRMTALDFIMAGGLGLIAAMTPRVAWISHNIKLHDLLLEDTKPVRFKQWASAYSETKVLIIFFLCQLFPLLIAVNVFRAGFDHAFGPHVLLSAEAIQSMWHRFNGACGQGNHTTPLVLP
jgi:hypothetical protein